MLLKACLNGPRAPAEHPALPIGPEALARDVALVASAGVGAIHFHAKSPAGSDTLEADDLAAALVAARSVRPAVPLGVTTGAWAVADPKERATLVRTWSVLPDFASVNWHEPGAETLTAALLERGVGVEAGLWHEQAVEAWLASPHRDDCFRVLLELPDGLDAADSRRNADVLLAAVGDSVREQSGCCSMVKAVAAGQHFGTPWNVDWPPGSDWKTPSSCPTAQSRPTTSPWFAPHSRSYERSTQLVLTEDRDQFATDYGAGLITTTKNRPCRLSGSAPVVALDMGATLRSHLQHAAVDDPGCAVDVRSLRARQESDDSRDLACITRSAQRNAGSFLR